MRLATGAAGIRYQQRTDVLLAVLAPGTQVAGVFTSSKTASAPVLWCRDTAEGGGRPARWWSIAAMPMPSPARPDRTGVRAVAEAAAAMVGCQAQEVFLASTGVIGEPLPAEKITRVLATLVAQEPRPASWRAAAEAIMTTDTYPKLATASADDRWRQGDHQRHRQRARA